MKPNTLHPNDLRFQLQPDVLGFSDTAELVQHPLPWIGQERAEQAAHFGLTLEQPDYNLFVLGEVGSGRSSLLLQSMRSVAATRPVPPDLCYLHNFDAPQSPRALRMPPGQGRELRQLMVNLVRDLQTEIPRRLSGEVFKAEAKALQSTYQTAEAKAYAELDAFAEARNFTLFREEGRLVFTLVAEDGSALSEGEARSLPKEQRALIEQAEQELRVEIARFIETMRPLERTTNEALIALRRQTIKPLLEHELQAIRVSLKKQIKNSFKLGAYLDQVQHDVLENLELFTPLEGDELEGGRREALTQLLTRYTINLVVDNAQRTGAPAIVEQNPVTHALFGSIEYQAEEDVLMTDFTHIRAGSLLHAHGGFLMLHLRDLLADETVWEKLRRYLRSGRVQIEGSDTSAMPMAATSLQPEAVDANVKIVLIGTAEQYYALQDADSEFTRHFRTKVDFAESFLANDDTRQGTAIFIAHTCQRLGLPHFSADGVARLLEDMHREVDDQTRQSAIFDRTETLIIESAAIAQKRSNWRSKSLVQAVDVDAALEQRRLRHNYPEYRLQQAIAEGDQLISTDGVRVGQLNGLTQIDLGDWRFGLPVRVTAQAHAGHNGLMNMEREVHMSGPIHDKGVLILHSYLKTLFADIAPLALEASIVFEQEYQGVEGDSASCAELLALLSSLSQVPLTQGIAITGALNQHGDVLPIGGVNEKIEGWFQVCQQQGLNGQQGVLIPERNRRHLMLNRTVVDAVEKGLFHVYTATHVLQSLALLTNQPSDAVLALVRARLLKFRRAARRK